VRSKATGSKSTEIQFRFGLTHTDSLLEKQEGESKNGGVIAPEGGRKRTQSQNSRDVCKSTHYKQH
jgi:hypothetical protein